MEPVYLPCSVVCGVAARIHRLCHFCKVNFQNFQIIRNIKCDALHGPGEVNQPRQSKNSRWFSKLTMPIFGDPKNPWRNHTDALSPLQRHANTNDPISWDFEHPTTNQKNRTSQWKARWENLLHSRQKYWDCQSSIFLKYVLYTRGRGRWWGHTTCAWHPHTLRGWFAALNTGDSVAGKYFFFRIWIINQVPVVYRGFPGRDQF